jgi:hypothetical protein
MKDQGVVSVYRSRANNSRCGFTGYPRGEVSTRVLVEMAAREAEHHMIRSED